MSSVYLYITKMDRGIPTNPPSYQLMPGEKPRKPLIPGWTPECIVYGPFEFDFTRDSIYRWFKERGWEQSGGCVYKVIDGVIHLGDWRTDIVEVLPISEFPTFEKAEA